MLIFLAFALVGVLLTSVQLLILSSAKVRFTASVAPVLHGAGVAAGETVASLLREFSDTSLQRINAAIETAVNDVNNDVLAPLSIVADAIHNKFADAQGQVLGEVTSWVSSNADFVFFGQTFIPDLINGLYVCLIGSKLQMFDSALQIIAGWRVQSLTLDPADLLADDIQASISNLTSTMTSYLLGDPVTAGNSSTTAHSGGAIEALLDYSLRAVRLARLANALALLIAVLFILQGCAFAMYQSYTHARSPLLGLIGQHRTRWNPFAWAWRSAQLWLVARKLARDSPAGKQLGGGQSARQLMHADSAPDKGMLSLQDLSGRAISSTALLGSEVLRRPGVINLRATERRPMSAADLPPLYESAFVPATPRQPVSADEKPSSKERLSPVPAGEVTMSDSEVLRGALRIGDPRLAAIARGYKDHKAQSK